MDTNNKLNDKQKENYNKNLVTYSFRGIELDLTVELWLNTKLYGGFLNNLNPKEDTENARVYLKYKDQFGVYHSAVRLERRFAKITAIEVSPSNDDYVTMTVVAEDEKSIFNMFESSDGWRWNENPKNGSLGREFQLATDAYNNPYLILDDEGKQPRPMEPLVVCKEHNYAYHPKHNCIICKDSFWAEKIMTVYPKLSLIRVSIKNTGIKTIEA